jgi:site-specific recombinase XerD
MAYSLDSQQKVWILSKFGFLNKSKIWDLLRRTMATRAIDKGMPIEQVQKLLGHQQIDTTMQYAMVNQNNVKSSHRKYMA